MRITVSVLVVLLATSPAAALFPSPLGFLDVDRSDVVPTSVLSDVGRIEAPLRTAGAMDLIEITPSMQHEDFEMRTELTDSSRRDDYFRFSVEYANGDVETIGDFPCSYGLLRLFTHDFDGDGVHEIVLQRGVGRGTCATTYFLEVLAPSRVSEGWRTDLRLEIAACGWTESPREVGVPWQREFCFERDPASGRSTLVIDSPPRPALFAGLGDVDDLLIQRGAIMRITREESGRFTLASVSLHPKPE
ncbi:MAG: hypothetical protein VYC34_01190 [Planctomycetota bacterium]|nr:hypothetical protein [Planctomycetota bacterium]